MAQEDPEIRLEALQKGPGGPVRAIKARVRTIVSSKKVRLRELFGAFDIHNNKKISQDCFLRALTVAGIIIPALGPSALLAQRYRAVGSTGRDDVDYSRFCAQIEKRPTSGKTTDADAAPAPPPPPEFGPDKLTFSAADAGSLRVLLGRLRHMTQTSGLVLRATFRDFDRRNNGCISPEDFVRSLSHI
ncbi:unnamed protein product, partial [Phaeothamnion confervicola]